MIYSLNYTNQI